MTHFLAKVKELHRCLRLIESTSEDVIDYCRVQIKSDDINYINLSAHPTVSPQPRLN